MKVPIKYKRNAATVELHKVKRIPSDIDKETKRVRSTYIDAGYPKYVIETLRNFNTKKVELIIFQWLFDEENNLQYASRFPQRMDNILRNVSQVPNSY